MDDKENEMVASLLEKGDETKESVDSPEWVEEEPSMMDQLLEKAGNWVDQKIEELPLEEQEAAEMKLMATADALVDTLDKAYTVTEKACDSIIDSLDELEKWIDKW